MSILRIGAIWLGLSLATFALAQISPLGTGHLPIGVSSCPGPYGGNDSFTKLLLHLDGINGSTTITDSSASVHTMVAGGTAKLSTAQFEFGTASATMSDTASYIYADGGSDFVFGADFTIDFWVQFASVATTTTLYDSRPNGVNGFYPTIYVGSSNLIFFTNNGARITGATTLSNSTWYHVALVRASGSTKLYLNGTQEGSTFTDSNSYINGASRPIMMNDGSVTYGLNGGFMDEIRVSKGIARWTTNFTPPTRAYC